MNELSSLARNSMARPSERFGWSLLPVGYRVRQPPPGKR
jgi:hypothetical protein